MFFANDSDGTRVYIYEAESNKKYFCPVCGQEVIQRRGSINVHHYAHKANRDELCDDWTHDMSDWHRDWQSMFPKESREVVIQLNGVKHRADIIIDKTVIEFQHSRISDEEFWERNEFYTEAGYEVVWLFDMMEEFDMEHIIAKDKDGHYKWNYHWHTFDDFVPRDNKDIKVFFQFDDRFSDGYYGIEQLVWLSPDGKHFVTNGAYDQDDFLALYIKKDNKKETEKNQMTEKQYTIADIQDLLVQSNGIYYPCPKTNGGMCFENCDCCKYSICCVAKDSIGQKFYNMYYERSEYLHAPYISGCLYRFKDIIENWNIENDKVININYDDEYKITELSIMKDGEAITKRYESTQRAGKTLLELLRENKCNVIGAMNIQTGIRVKIGNSDYFSRNNIKRIQGYLGHKNDRDYFSDRREIFGWNKKEWILEWCK